MGWCGGGGELVCGYVEFNMLIRRRQAGTFQLDTDYKSHWHKMVHFICLAL